jgi:hypothetical protein
MSKKIFHVFSLLLLVVLLASTASPAFAAGGKSASLAAVRFIPGKGVVFIFDLQGEFKKSDLKGSVTIEGHTYPLYCRFNDAGQASCTSIMMNQYAGKAALILFAGSSFSDTIPAERACPYKAISFHWPGEATWTFTVKPEDLAGVLASKPASVTIDAVYCIEFQYTFYGSD